MKLVVAAASLALCLNALAEDAAKRTPASPRLFPSSRASAAPFVMPVLVPIKPVEFVLVGGLFYPADQKERREREYRQKQAAELARQREEQRRCAEQQIRAEAGRLTLERLRSQLPSATPHNGGQNVVGGPGYIGSLMDLRTGRTQQVFQHGNLIQVLGPGVRQQRSYIVTP